MCWPEQLQVQKHEETQKRSKHSGMPTCIFKYVQTVKTSLKTRLNLLNHVKPTNLKPIVSKQLQRALDCIRDLAGLGILGYSMHDMFT